MQLVHSIEIRGLRSLQQVELDEVGHFTSIVGKNSAGKSNVLRALNLFFHGEVGPGEPLMFSRDTFRAIPRTRKKKMIEVKVRFRLPTAFNFPKPLKSNLAKLGNDFTITRRWTLNKQDLPIDEFVLVGMTSVGNQQELAQQFLNLITFRYIPNRTVPALVLRDESRSLAKSLQIRLKGKGSVTDLVQELQTAAAAFLRPASVSMSGTGAPLSDPAVAAPKELGELFSLAGFQARGRSGDTIRDEDWGSGHQAFFLYQLLYALDTHYSRFFGWKQATIWGVEEPESGLHRELETRLAAELRAWTLDKRSKLQVLQTTHSPVFTMAGDAGYWVELSGPSSKLTRSPIPRLVRDSELRGVSGWIQPILAFPTSPVVLVEGPIDVDVLTHVAETVGRPDIKFLCLPQLDPAEKAGGKDSIVTYMRRHGGLLASRAEGAPLIVLLDWDVSDQELAKARSAYGSKGSFGVVRQDKTMCHSRLGPNFRGIERFYPLEVVRDAISRGELVAVDRPPSEISVAADKFTTGKNALKTRVLQRTSSTGLGAGLTGLIAQVEKALKVV
ncbi:MAG: AAA family ATPase [Deltaproteobacteria bacterium]